MKLSKNKLRQLIKESLKKTLLLERPSDEAYELITDQILDLAQDHNNWGHKIVPQHDIWNLYSIIPQWQKRSFENGYIKSGFGSNECFRKIQIDALAFLFHFDVGYIKEKGILADQSKKAQWNSIFRKLKKEDSSYYFDQFLLAYHKKYFRHEFKRAPKWHGPGYIDRMKSDANRTPIHILYVSQNKEVLMQKIKSIPNIEKTLATINMSIEQLVKTIFDFKFSIIPDLGSNAGSMGQFGVCNINYKYYASENIPKYIDIDKPQKSDYDAVINSLSGGNLELAKVFLNYITHDKTELWSILGLNEIKLPGSSLGNTIIHEGAHYINAVRSGIEALSQNPDYQGDTEELRTPYRSSMSRHAHSGAGRKGDSKFPKAYAMSTEELQARIITLRQETFDMFERALKRLGGNPTRKGLSKSLSSEYQGSWWRMLTEDYLNKDDLSGAINWVLASETQIHLVYEDIPEAEYQKMYKKWQRSEAKRKAIFAKNPNSPQAKSTTDILFYSSRNTNSFQPTPPPSRQRQSYKKVKVAGFDKNPITTALYLTTGLIEEEYLGRIYNRILDLLKDIHENYIEDLPES